tara:strand:+ start:9090 stop:10016 length:927 start_codon:yes stop_codon:yes gene_type:complete
MRISVRMEGGLGDHLLANRFVPAILDKYENAEIHLFSDTGGKTLQSDTLLSLYDFYKSRTLIERKSENYLIHSQFGEENFPAHINNIKDKQKRLMLSFDHFFNFHIDWMEWTRYDIHWQNYFFHFPKPKLEFPATKKGKEYIVMHIASDNMGNDHRMSREYLNSIILKIPSNYSVKVLSTPSTEKFVTQSINKKAKVEIVSLSLPDAISLVKHASGLIAIDSGIKYFGYTFNVPTVCWAKESSRANSCPLAFQVRWLTFSQTVFPLEHDPKNLVQTLLNLIESNNFILAPSLKSSELDRHLIRRVTQE